MRNSSSIADNKMGAAAKLFIGAAARRFLFALTAIVLLAAGQAGAQNAQPQNVQPVAAGNARGASNQASIQNTGPADSYRLGSGDRVRITVFGQPELTGEYAIDGGGQMSYPLIGQIRAGGLTAAELEKDLIGKLSPGYLRNPSVSVEVLTYRPFYIVGEVRTPGSYPFVNGMTVLNAVALAGGFTYRARESSFYLTRTDESGTKSKLNASPETAILPGDIITVRERYF